MSENLVPNVLTPVVPAELYKALSAVWPTVIGGADPSRTSLLILLAQIGTETGWKSCHNYNLGNAKHVPGDGHDYCQFRCYEIVGGKTVWFDPPHPATSFRAFPNLEAGAADYLSLLHRRFALAWPALMAGDAAGFVHGLKQAHYFTADEATYTRAVVGIMGYLEHQIPDPQALTVQQAQQELIDQGYDLGPAKADGVLGGMTKAALSAYQQAKGLPVTGSLDSATQAQLRADIQARNPA